MVYWRYSRSYWSGFLSETTSVLAAAFERMVGKATTPNLKGPMSISPFHPHALPPGLDTLHHSVYSLQIIEPLRPIFSSNNLRAGGPC